jgi:hypothetical protein
MEGPLGRWHEVVDSGGLDLSDTVLIVGHGFESNGLGEVIHSCDDYEVRKIVDKQMLDDDMWGDLNFGSTCPGLQHPYYLFDGENFT